MQIILEFIFRWAHVLFGITWIGMLYYFNFVQGEYFKEAEADAKSDAMKKLAPRALWWFRWGAMFTFLTGLYLLYSTGAHSNMLASPVIWIGATAGIFMFLNVWLVIWPAQQVVLGMKEGDGPASAAKAGLASRTNTLFSLPMALGMIASSHGGGAAGNIVLQSNTGFQGIATGLAAVLAITLILEANAIFGKMGPMASVRGVIHCSVVLTIVCLALLQFV